MITPNPTVAFEILHFVAEPYAKVSQEASSSVLSSMPLAPFFIALLFHAATAIKAAIQSTVASEMLAEFPKRGYGDVSTVSFSA